MSLKDRIIEALKKVQAQELKQGAVPLKLVYDFDIDEEKGIVKFKFMPTTPDCSIGMQLAFVIRDAVKEVPEVKKVQLRVAQFICQNQLNTYSEEIEKEEKHTTATDRNGNVWTKQCNTAELFMTYAKYGHFLLTRDNALIKGSLTDKIIKFVNLPADIKTLTYKTSRRNSKKNRGSTAGLMFLSQPNLAETSEQIRW